MPTDCKYKDEIKKVLELTEENRAEINLMKNQDWYNNKELYEMISNLKEQFQEFNDNFHKYNGLVEKYQVVLETQQTLNEKVVRLEKEKVEDEAEIKASKETNNNWKVWIGWVVATALGLFQIAQIVGG